jgi:hypothetical protein
MAKQYASQMAHIETKVYNYYDIILVAFVTLLLCSNLIGATKVCKIGGITFGGTLLFFPITYLFGDILTEVYGYKRWLCRLLLNGIISTNWKLFLAKPLGWSWDPSVRTLWASSPIPMSWQK